MTQELQGLLAGATQGEPECDGAHCRGYDPWLGCKRIRQWKTQQIVDEAIANLRHDIAKIMGRTNGH